MKKPRDTTLLISPDYLKFIKELKARVVSWKSKNSMLGAIPSLKWWQPN